MQVLIYFFNNNNKKKLNNVETYVCSSGVKATDYSSSCCFFIFGYDNDIFVKNNGNTTILGTLGVGGGLIIAGESIKQIEVIIVEDTIMLELIILILFVVD
jgi:hypothetical protein